MLRHLLTLTVIALCVTNGGGTVEASAPPPDDAAVLHVLNRLTYGPRPGDIERVRAIGVQNWIETQLNPSRIDDAALAGRLSRLETLTLDSQTIQRDYAGPAMVERRRRQQETRDDGNREPGTESPELMAGSTIPDSRSLIPDPRSLIPDPRSGQASETMRRARQVMGDIEEAKLLRAVYSERQLEEVLVDFWFNHFNVFAGKGATRNYITEYERDAIRPYVLGHFRELLGATAKSPAMLFYLDNWLSSGAAGTALQGARVPSAGVPGAGMPGAGVLRSEVQREAPMTGRRPTGLNENYARELLELHTLGVDGGYTQEDIVNVARAFTGWTMRPRQGSGFIFVAARHDRGEKRVLSHTIRAAGIADGEQVLDIVAAHPSTAKRIALKLAMRFVSDNPPPSLVDRAAARFTATKGDLREVVKTIVSSPEFTAADAQRAKVKTPLEFVASALRATGADVRNAIPLTRALADMGMPLYRCQPPTGYDETSSAWVSAGALVSRMNFAVDLSKNAVRGVRVPLSEEQTLALKIGAPEFQRQ